jgi:dTDP-glucose 4,6-dehydratase
MGMSKNKIEYVEDRIGHDQRYSVDFSKINRELGYSPQVEFEEGLKKTIDWYKFNNSWWLPLKLRK